MKKFVVLMLVLGMASLASAVPVLTSAITSWTDGNVTWGLDMANGIVTATTDTAGAYSLSMIQQTSGYGRLDPTAYADLALANGNSAKVGTYEAAGDNGQVWDPYGNPNDGLYWNVEASDLEAGGIEYATGRLFEFDYTVDGNADFSMTYWNGSAFETLLQTPEPMTMVLLGLGGLFLRRRKA